MIENIIRNIVRSILKEAQINKKVEGHIKNLLDNSTLDVMGEFPYNDKFIMSEVKKAIQAKLNKIAQMNFDYTNFYIIKLGNFIVKDGDTKTKLAFNNPNFDKNFSMPYIYVYQDKVIILKFGSRFYDTDDKIKKDAERFIKTSSINLTTLTESGKVILMNDFDTDNIIDLTDYSKVQRPEPKEKTMAPLKQKADYRAGTPYVHSKFGKGTIVSSKKFGVDEEGNIVYDVLINFKDYGEKKLRLKSTKKRNEKIVIEPGVKYRITNGPFSGANAVGIDPENLEVDISGRKITLNKYKANLELEPIS